jgi:hypothetical protein
LIGLLSYLKNQTQFVKIGKAASMSQTIVCGVPQGSTLGPLLFLLYINDMPNSLPKLSFRIFADGTNLFFKSKNIDELENVMNNELQGVMTYCKISKLSINHKKTKLYDNKLSTTKMLKNLYFKQKHCGKYLGVFIDDHLNWENQIKHINSKISKNLEILYKLRGCINLKILKHLYYTLVYPYLNYAPRSWGNTYKSKLTKISTKQNRCI